VERTGEGGRGRGKGKGRGKGEGGVLLCAMWRVFWFGEGWEWCEWLGKVLEGGKGVCKGL